MANIAVLGAGLIGKAIALDLANEHAITSIDCDDLSLKELTNRNNSIRVIQADLSIPTNIVANINDADLVISAVPGFMGYETLKTIIQSNKNVVDIAFFPEDSLDLDSLAKKHKVTAVVDMGVAPGLSNLVLGYHSNDMVIEEFKCMVGGLPKHPKPPFNYKAPFSPVDVIEEYIRPARIVRDGKQITLPALSELELVEFENVGTLEAFNTDGLRTLTQTFPDIPSMVEKTLRYPGHAALIQALKDTGYLDTEVLKVQERSGSNNVASPFEVTTALLKKHWKLEAKEPEFTIMRINISGRPKHVDKSDSNQKLGKITNYQYDLYDEYDHLTDIGSMARTTGYACTAAANLVLDKTISTTGIIPPEVIGQTPPCFQTIMAYYKERGVNLRQSVSAHVTD